MATNKFDTIYGSCMDFLQKFFPKEDKPDAIRIHISHDDMDGYGCTMLTRIIEEENGRECGVHLLNTGLRQEEQKKIGEQIRQIIGMHFEVGMMRFEHTVVSLLITDISKFDIHDFIGPTLEIYPDLPYEYLVIDHHQHPELQPLQTATPRNMYDTSDMCIRTMTDFGRTMVEAYYYDTAWSATKLYYNMLSFNYYGTIITPSRIKAEICNGISGSDTGHFGKWWAAQNIEQLTPAMELRLFWSWGVKNFSDPNNWIGYMTARIAKLEECPDLMFGSFIFAIDNTKVPGAGYRYDACDLWLFDMYKKAVKSELDALMKELRDYEYNLKEMLFNNSIVIPEKLKGIKLYTTSVQDPATGRVHMTKNFSMISTAIFAQYPYINVLVGADTDRQQYQLCSRSANYNVAELAIANGGGGHVQAAGFPFPTGKK